MAISPGGLASLMRAIPAQPRSAEGPPPPSPAPGGPGAAPPGMGGSDLFGAVVSRTLSDAGSADPSYIIDQLKQMKVISAEIIQKAVLRHSEVAKHVAASLRSLDAAVTAAEKAQSAIAAQGPINFSGANAAPPAGPPNMPQATPMSQIAA